MEMSTPFALRYRVIIVSPKHGITSRLYADLGASLVAQHWDCCVRIRDRTDVVASLAAHEAAHRSLFFWHDLVQRPWPNIFARRTGRILAQLEEIGRLQPACNRRHHTGHPRWCLEARRCLKPVRRRRHGFLLFLLLFLGFFLFFLCTTKQVSTTIAEQTRGERTFFWLELAPRIPIHRFADLNLASAFVLLPCNEAFHSHQHQRF